MVTPVCEISDIQNCEHKIGLGGCIHLQIKCFNYIVTARPPSSSWMPLILGSYSLVSKMFCWVELQLYEIKVTKVNLETVLMILQTFEK